MSNRRSSSRWVLSTDWVCAWLRNELRVVLSDARGRRLYVSRNELRLDRPSGSRRKLSSSMRCGHPASKWFMASR